MDRTLLPVWAVYKAKYNLEVEEANETFDWIVEPSARDEYKNVKDALSKIPDARSFLKDYVCPRGSQPFFDEFGCNLMSALGSHHSGASATRLALNYKYLLNNWRDFVLETKTYYARMDYTQRQIEENETWAYYNAKTSFNLLSNPYVPDSHNSLKADVDCEIENLRQKFNINYTSDQICAMLDDLIEEYRNVRIEQTYKYKVETFNSMINILEHHYEYPTRWQDSEGGSFLFGSPYLVTEEMIAVMEKKYVDYRAHIESIKAKFLSY